MYNRSSSSTTSSTTESPVYSEDFHNEEFNAYAKNLNDADSLSAAAGLDRILRSVINSEDQASAALRKARYEEDRALRNADRASNSAFNSSRESSVQAGAQNDSMMKVLPIRPPITSSNHLSLQEQHTLTRDVSTAARGNLAHYIWQASFGYNLHPHIAASLQEQGNLRIADIGTGSGIWLLDLANSLPNSHRNANFIHFDGLYSTLSHCPPKAWLPQNVNFRTFDIHRSNPSAVPADLLGTYDFIHVRHCMNSVPNNDPMPLLSTLVRMLKPGGWIQWGEWDVYNRHITKTSSTLPQTSMDRLESELAGVMPNNSNAIETTLPQRLDDYFLEVGLQEVCMEKRKSPKTHLPQMHDLTLLSLKEIIDDMEAQVPAPNDESIGADDEALRAMKEHVKYLRTLFAGAVKESKQGLAWNLTRCMAVGRKELSAGVSAGIGPGLSGRRFPKRNDLG